MTDRTAGRGVGRLAALRLAALVTISMTATLLLGSPASAAGQSSNRGTYQLVDSASTPGAICVYPTPSTNDFIGKITVRAPRVWAFNRTTGTDIEWVGWRYRIDYAATGNPLPGDWHTVTTSGVAKATATDSRRAKWKDRSYSFHNYGLAGSYRVSIQIRWYHPGQTKVDAKVSRLVMNYLERPTGFPDFLSAFPKCEGNLG